MSLHLSLVIWGAHLAKVSFQNTIHFWRCLGHRGLEALNEIANENYKCRFVFEHWLSAPKDPKKQQQKKTCSGLTIFAFFVFLWLKKSEKKTPPRKNNTKKHTKHARRLSIQLGHFRHDETKGWNHLRSAASPE